MKVITLEKESEILNLYNQGIRPKQIAELLSINFATLCSWFHNKHPEIKFRPKQGNTHYFDAIDSYAKSYILGFIAADGALVKDTKHPERIDLTITIKYEDRAVLEFIKSEIGNEHKLLEIRKPSPFDSSKEVHHIRYAIRNSKLAPSLLKYGISTNKSLTMGNIIENIPYEYRDAFIIGYFDGDGSVSIKEGEHLNNNGYYVKDYSLYINIRGTKEFLKGICSHLNITESHIRQYDSIPSLSFASKKDVIRFYECYDNLPFYYKRKHDKFLLRINHPSYDKYKQGQTISSFIE